MLSEPFARVLAAGRTRFNQRAAQVKTRFPAFDFAAFGQFLQSGVEPVFASVVELAPERAQAIAEAAYDISLELSARVLVGPAASSPYVNEVWRHLIPQYAPIVARQPRETLGLLSNAVIHLQSVRGARPSQWIEEMATIASSVTSLPHLQAVGQILAWRAGAAHFRQGAIEAADQLPEALALAAFRDHGAGTWTTLRSRMLDDLWWRASDDTQGLAAREVGSFTGLDGAFPVPPQVRACPGGFLIKSGERYFLLVADAYGAVLHAATKDEFEDAAHWPSPIPLTFSGSSLSVNGRQVEFNLPVSGLAACCNDTTVAITSPYTHAICLLPMQ